MKNKNLQSGDNWKTPKYFYDPLNAEFGFDFDPCPYSEGAPIFNGLSCEWGEVNFCNPPYSTRLKEAFIHKGIAEWRKGKTVVFLIPATTETKIFHDVILPNNPEIRFIRGRIRFAGYNTKGAWVENKCGLSGSMLVIFKGKRENK